MKQVEIPALRKKLSEAEALDELIKRLEVAERALGTRGYKRAIVVSGRSSKDEERIVLPFWEPGSGEENITMLIWEWVSDELIAARKALEEI